MPRRACALAAYIERASRCEAEVKSSNKTYTTKLTKLVAASERSSETPRAVLPSCGGLLVSYWPLAPASAATSEKSAQGLVSQFVCATHRALQTVPYRAHALRHHAQLHTSRLPASPQRCSMQPVASVSAALDQPVSASATSRLRPENAPKRPMTTILFTRPNIHRVDRRSAWLKLRGHTRDRDENTSLD